MDTQEKTQAEKTPVNSEENVTNEKTEDPKKGPDVDETNRHKYDDGKPAPAQPEEQGKNEEPN